MLKIKMNETEDRRVINHSTLVQIASRFDLVWLCFGNQGNKLYFYVKLINIKL